MTTHAPAEPPAKVPLDWQRFMIKQWMGDQKDLDHPKPVEFWTTSVAWDSQVLQEEFTRYLQITVGKHYAEIKNSLSRLRANCNFRMTWDDHVYKPAGKKDFNNAWHQQRPETNKVADWSDDKIKEWFTHLRDELPWARGMVDNLVGWERYMEALKRDGHPDMSGYWPEGLLTKRWRRTYP